METKQEPKYLDLSAHAEVNLAELLDRLQNPKQEEQSNEDNN